MPFSKIANTRLSSLFFPNSLIYFLFFKHFSIAKSRQKLYDSIKNLLRRQYKTRVKFNKPDRINLYPNKIITRNGIHLIIQTINLVLANLEATHAQGANGPIPSGIPQLTKKERINLHYLIQ